MGRAGQYSRCLYEEKKMAAKHGASVDFGEVLSEAQAAVSRPSNIAPKCYLNPLADQAKDRERQDVAEEGEPGS